MALNFNVSPYYDDFDQTKNYHRILFKPGVAVQARELTQSQTILQDQITKFADNIFKQNSPVTGGNITTNFNCYYIKLQSTYNNASFDVTTWIGKLIKDSTGNVLARVITASAATGTGGTGDPPTLIVSYKSGTRFTDGSVIYDTASSSAVQAITSGSTGLSSATSIDQGVFYVLGNFVQIQPSTIVVNKYSNTPNARIGLTITESITNYVNDSTLLDPAIGASNYQAPGADRYEIALTLDTRTLDFGGDDNFIELVRITNGSIQKLVDGSVYNIIDDYFAKRDYETNGDYVVNDFKLTPKTYAADSTKYTMSIGKGLAYVHGYRVENQASIDLVSNRARTYATQNNDPITADYGSYFFVDNVNGGNASFFGVTTYQSIDLHCVPVANVNVATAAAYSSTVVSSGYIRGLVYNSTTSSNANSYIYKAYVSDLQNASPSANAVAATANTITFPSTYSTSNSAYNGVGVSIIKGTDSGDFRTIVAYNGSTKVATINQNWSTTPDTTSVFALNFDIKDVETMFAVDTSRNIQGYANINNLSRANGSSLGATVLINPTTPELVMPIGSPYVRSLSSAQYTSTQEWTSVGFDGTGTATISFTSGSGAPYNGVLLFPTTGTLSATDVPNYFTVVVTNKGATSLNVGDIIPWTTSGRSVSIDSTKKTATFTGTASMASITATIIAKVYVTNADDTSRILKTKTLITANTTVVATSNTQVNTYTFVDDTATTSSGQIHIQNAGLVTPGTKQSLYLSDVKSLTKILATTSGIPTTAGLSGYTDVTSRYSFDNGQRDSYYDHASITLNPGATQPTGDLLIFANYYQHTGGDGYFDVNSYTNDTYQQLPTYTSKGGVTYYLRDCVDFRPARKNAQTSFIFKYSNATSNYGLFLPIDATTFSGNYSYYLGRKDKLVLSKDRSFQVIEGTPSINPIFPNEPDGSLVVANLIHDPYTGYIPTEVPTGYVSNLSVEKVKHRRYTMEDIAGLEKRINNIEYYTSLSVLEQNAQSLQISDAYGLNRFKNGILVDDFSSYSTADTVNTDYSATINRRERLMTATQTVKNFPLVGYAVVNNMGLPSTSTISGLGYAINSEGHINYFSLPYTTANAITQKFASRTVNVNPFSFSSQEGVLEITPNVDNWVDTNYAPSLLITAPGLQVFRANAQSLNVLSAGDWKSVSGTTLKTESYQGGTLATWTTTSTSTQTNIIGPYDNIGSTYSLNNGYITDVSILPFIRPQQVVLRAKGLLINTTLTSYFDNTSVDQYIRKANIIELTNVNGSFVEDDVIGYTSGGTFVPTARIVGIYNYPSTSNTRLYVSADNGSNTYSTLSTLQNAYFDTNGLNAVSTANGTIVSSTHNSGSVNNAISTTKVQLSVLASSTNNYYTGNTLYINVGTAAGQSASISAYYGANQTAILSSAVTAANGDFYSIGSFSTNESGAFNGIFSIPANVFHTGQRVLRLDNSTGGNQSSATTYAEGTYYAEGLQTTQQGVDFGSSPAGAKQTFSKTNSFTTTNVSQWLYRNDPVAQTFLIDEINYPNGAFLNSVKLFFRTKPTVYNTPITVSIVGTLNGYPDGNTLDHSIVTLTPDAVNVSENPQYLDPTAYTKFNFSAPVYIQPGILYAFIVHSTSNEYTLWTASNGDIAVSSSVKNLPTDATPSVITKIGSAPYVGALFLSQNSQTWSADQNQDLMFVMDRCVFDTTLTPKIQFVIPKKLPQATLIDQSIKYYLNANTLSSSIDNIANTDILVDAFNITTSDFTPTTTGISYTYNPTLSSGTLAGETNITPGKYGTAAAKDIYLDDNRGERILLANSVTSFSVYGTLSSTDNAVSPIISDAGLSAYAIQWNINNCPLSNNLVTLTSGGGSYTAATTVTISAPTASGGTQAYATANISGGIIKNIYITGVGSGYITTPTITITDSGGGTGASANIAGETSATGGPATAKYVTKKVLLDAGNDSGDLNVYITAYRPNGTDIHVYYKILNRNDTQKFENGSWQLMTKINSTGNLYSLTRDNLYEYAFAPGTVNLDQGYVSYTSTNGQTYTTFSQFALKVVMTTSDNTTTPFLSDLRAIALPPNVNTTL